MNAQRLAQVEDIYHAVLEVAEDKWPSFLSRSCGGDHELRREVESLLSFSDKPHSLIDVPPLDVAAEVVRENSRPDIIGKNINHYKIISQLGTGGMGDVYLANDTMLERNVAIKFVSAQFAHGTAGIGRFLREAKAASALNHPNIITVYEVGKTKDTPFIATEFIDGKNLRMRMDEGGLSFRESLGIASQAASALVAAHSAGIFHRDIKPENLMIREDKLVKVVDFGLAKIAGAPGIETDGSFQANDPQLSAPGLVMGTLAYMSPEQATGKAADARSDIWSLGVVMYEMFFGEKPFKGNTPGEVKASILNDQPELFAGNVPANAGTVLSKMLVKDPGQRYQNAAELLTDISELDRNLGTAAHFDTASRAASRAVGTQPSVSSAEYVVGEVKKHKILGLATAAILVAILSVAGYFYVASGSKPVSSIAVMPFENESGDLNAEYLSDGMSEALINELSQLSGIKVIARDSSFKYKGQKPDLQQIARELGVQAVLSGRVLQRDGRLQVSAELIDVRDNTQIWGGRFDRGPTNVQQVQDEILRQIVGKLGLQLSRTEQARIDNSTEIDPKAYELYLKGSFYRSISSEDGANKAVDFYQQAIAIDPNYAEAHAALSRTYIYLGANGFKDQKEMAAKAEAAARRALELDDSNAEVHLAMAGIKKTAYDWAGADLEFKRAAELNPNLAAVHFSYSFFLVTQGRNEEAILEAKRSRELDPLRRNVNQDMGFIYYFARQYDLALEQYNTGVELRPDNGPAFYGRGFTYAAMGRHDEALADYKEMQRLSGEFTGLDCYIGVSLVSTGRVTEAKTVLKSLETGKKYVSPAELAILYTSLGERDKALTSLERAVAERDPQIQYLLIEPNYDDLRSEPRFAALVRNVGLPL